MARTQLNIRVPQTTIDQVNDLMQHGYESQSHVVMIAVNNLHQQEQVNMNTVEYKGFTIQVTEEMSGYGYLATDEDGAAFGTKPQTATTEAVYDTPGKAVAQAKRIITKFLNDLAYGE